MDKKSTSYGVFFLLLRSIKNFVISKIFNIFAKEN